MTDRKTRKLQTRVTTEDAFGTPPAARDGMMKVAGRTDDEIEPGEEILDEEDPTTMSGPIYPEGKVRVSVGALREIVRTAIRRSED